MLVPRFDRAPSEVVATTNSSCDKAVLEVIAFTANVSPLLPLMASQNFAQPALIGSNLPRLGISLFC